MLPPAAFNRACLTNDLVTFHRALGEKRAAGRAPVLSEGVMWKTLEQAIQQNFHEQVEALLPEATFPAQKTNQSLLLHALNAALGAGGRPAQPPGPRHRTWAETLFRLTPPTAIEPLYEPAIASATSNPVVIHRAMLAHALRWRIDGWVEEVWAQGVDLDTRWQMLAAALHPVVGRLDWVERLLADQDPYQALNQLGHSLFLPATNRGHRFEEELGNLLLRVPVAVAETWTTAHAKAGRPLAEVTWGIVRSARRQAELHARPATAPSRPRHRA